LTPKSTKKKKRKQTMADVRALLKAKRQEARITHPYAVYGANGALRCTACGVAVKFASAWEAHLGSKSHRVAVANLKAKREEESARTTTAAAAMSKRKAEEEGPDGGDDDMDGQMEVEMTEPSRAGKRQRTEEREVGVVGAAEVQANANANAASSSRSFPMGFFSDPARAPPLRGQDDEDEEDEDAMDQDEKEEKGTTTTAPKSQLDVEWDAFERELQGLSSHPTRQGPGRPAEEGATTTDPREAYARATIAAEPELVPGLVGIPASSGQEGGAAQGSGEVDGGGEGEGGKKTGISEAEERRRKEMDERELIMDRFVEEERAQEDAYNRVALLRNRVQMLKQKRELAKAKGKKADAQSRT
jgi:zinc finger protein 830